MHGGLFIYNQKHASCSKSAAGLLPCCHQADIRMRSHRLLRFDDNKSVACCQHFCFKLIVKTFIHRLDPSCFKNMQQVLQISSCVNPDFHGVNATEKIL